MSSTPTSPARTRMSPTGDTRRPRHLCVALFLTAVAMASVTTGPAAAERAGARPGMSRLLAGRLDAGNSHTCAVTDGGRVRCWGYGQGGQLGYGNTSDIGDNEAPSYAGPVDLGPSRTATAVSAGAEHTCALLDDATVRCWGTGFGGKLGYGNVTTIGDNETPGSVGPVDLGIGRTATAVTAGGYHSCALLDNGTVRCWGAGTTFFGSGHLGYGNTNQIGDDETPGSVGPVDLGAGRTATAITAGSNHTCALLDDGAVRCWGSDFFNQLGSPGSQNIGDNETPGSVAPVDLGAGRTATAIAAGSYHTCALLDNGSVRCWGSGSSGPVDLGAGMTATAIAAGAEHTCALLNDATVRCWGKGRLGKLGYGNVNDIGDDETPGSAGPVDVGAGRTVTAITAGVSHTCAVLDNGTTRCWGDNANGRHGYPYTAPIGDNETPQWAAPLSLNGLISVAPGAPTAATATATGPGQVTVAWTAPADPGSAPLTGYRVSWIPPSYPKGRSGTTSQTTAYLSGLEEGTYQFTIVAINPARTSPPAVTGTVIVSDTPNPPSE